MKKTALLMTALILLSAAAFAANGTSAKTAKEIKFRDMPDSHWAAKAVYKLVKMGVTQGYPDGTFRGTKNMTRFETAMFLSKMAESLGSAGMDKLSAELKSEFQSLKTDMGMPVKISGTFEADIYIGNIFAVKGAGGADAPRGPLFNYRLMTTLFSKTDANSEIRINIDTMDGGYYGGSSDLLTKMIDAELVIRPETKLPLVVTATVGPGPQRHLLTSEVIPSDYGKTYLRPYTGVKFASKIAAADVEIAYSAHNIQSSGNGAGQIGVNQVTGQIGCDWAKIPFLSKVSARIRGDYFSQNTNNLSVPLTNLKSALSVDVLPSDGIRLSGEIRWGANRDISSSRMAVLAGIGVSGILGAELEINATLAGSKYLDESNTLDQWAFLGFDPFDRPRVNGSRAVAFKLRRPFTSSLVAVGKGTLDLSREYRYGTGYAGSRYTLEGGFNVSLGSKTDAVILYRIDQDPNAADQTTDLFTLGLTSRF